MFDEQPDGDPHGECAAEIRRLQAALRAIVNHWREFGPEYGFDECVERFAAPLVPSPVEVAAPDVTLTQDEAAFLAARLRRLFAHHGYALPKFASDDARLIGVAGSCIGAVLANADDTVPGLTAPDGEQR